MDAVDCASPLRPAFPNAGDPLRRPFHKSQLIPDSAYQIPVVAASPEQASLRIPAAAKGRTVPRR
jgi:hypothetical protein